MNTEKALLGEILDRPDDDLPRLVYADWLDEHGDTDRADFIRTQVQLARMDPDDPRRAAWEGRARQLWGQHHGEWLAPFGAFRRGFAEHVRDSIPGYLARADRWARVAPVQRVDLYQEARARPNPSAA